MRILFLVPYPPGEAPSQRFRFEQYFSHLRKAGHTYNLQSYLSLEAWKNLYQAEDSFSKAFSIISGFFKRLGLLPTLGKYDFVFIHREAAPVGPPFFEWIISKIFRKKIIYDFDDAIWMTDKTSESTLQKIIRWRSKVGSICSWSYKISCGNQYLADYAKQFNLQVIVNPTTIDTEAMHNPKLFAEKASRQLITIGWTGSHSTLKYLKVLEEAIKVLEKKHALLRFLVIADQKPLLNIQSMEFLSWKKNSEVHDLMKIDIGVMPLPDDDWSKGKCGFKALQYMALEIPTVASPVGVNSNIVDHGKNGFLCSTHEEWVAALELLVQDVALRKQIGQEGRKKIISHYSVESNAAVFLSLFQ
ncbi:MAG: glycosyltransferase family 4 protein [Cyclobacteriaceae bacterium]